MAQSYTTTSGTLIIPGAYSSYTVQNANAGLATSGIIALVGESDSGPRFSGETDLEDNAFGPDQLSDVIAKYKSGPIVDAFRAVIAPANDPQITGAPSRIVIVKTNDSTKASSAIAKWDTSNYGTLYDKSYGKLGNLLYYTISANTSEVVPTTSSFTYIPAVGTVDIEFRVNGGAAATANLSANTSPTAFVAAVTALTGVLATGGADRSILTVSGTLLLDANPGGAGTNVIDLTRSIPWGTTPTAGDTLTIPTGSVVAGAGDANVGAYVITSATSTTIRATKLSDADKAGAVAGIITAPVDVSPAVAIVAVTDAKAWSPAVISNEAGDPLDGLGKSLEIAQLTTGTDLAERTAYQLGTTTAVTWVSKTGSAKLLTSSSEYQAKLSMARQVDGVAEDLIAGGEVAMKLAYTGTTATVTITSTTLTTSVTGGSGSNLSITLADFPTISDLATYINSQTGYSAAVGTAVLGQLPSTALDRVSAAGICTKFGEKNGRLKVDAYKFFKKIDEESSVVQLGNPAARAASGLPKTVSTVTYLAGGAKGGTLSTDVTAAVDALERVRCNFIVPLFSQDATADITAGKTESSSTYTIDAINAYVKSHVLGMSTLKKRRNRQAFLSLEDDFTAQKNAAANLASFRCSLCFQDFKQVDSSGSITQFQPWMGAVLAAGMQAAGFYRGLVKKGINTSGVVHADGSFSDKSDSNLEDALTSGLLPAKRELTGGFTWVSDQTTYSKDSNFVYNSIQAIYMADVIALTLAERMERTFVGQSTADISAQIALSFLEGTMADFMRLKMISASDDAPKGFKNAKIKISGTAMIVELEVKLAGILYFVPISFQISQVQQTAG